jgi:hypothetical protein
MLEARFSTSPEIRLPDDRSAILAAIHLAYDGPLPRALSEALRNGGARRLGRLHRQSESREIDRRAGACRARIAAGRIGEDTPTGQGELARLRAAGLALSDGMIA